MRLWMGLGLLAVLTSSCDDKDVVDSDTVSADTDTDTDADSDTDADTDSDTDTDPDLCLTGTNADLIWTIEVYDASQTLCTTCPLGDQLIFRARVSNPCPNNLSFRSYIYSDWCLANQWSITDAVGDRMALPMADCGIMDIETDWIIPGEGSLTSSIEHRPQEAGDYTVDARFIDPQQSTASTDISVQ